MLALATLLISALPALPVRAVPKNALSEANRAAFQDVLAAHKAELNACSDADKSTDRNLFTLIWDIEADGSVSNVGVSDEASVTNPLANCVAEAVKRWRFPKRLAKAKTVEMTFGKNAVGVPSTRR